MNIETASTTERIQSGMAALHGRIDKLTNREDVQIEIALAQADLMAEIVTQLDVLNHTLHEMRRGSGNR
jgi:hypothetical protein